jgi:hypothetical protein
VHVARGGSCPSCSSHGSGTIVWEESSGR